MKRAADIIFLRGHWAWVCCLAMDGGNFTRKTKTPHSGVKESLTGQSFTWELNLLKGKSKSLFTVTSGMTKPTRSKLEIAMKCFSCYHLLWISNKVVTSLAEFLLGVTELGFHPWKSCSAGGAHHQSVSTFHSCEHLWVYLQCFIIQEQRGYSRKMKEAEI